MRGPRRSPGIIGGLVLAVAAMPALGDGPGVTPDSLTDAQVRTAIRAIVDEIYRRKDPDRFWDPGVWDDDDHGQRAQIGGYTPLAVLALLYAGESYQDPRLRDAIAFLEETPLRGTYSVAVRAHVWAALPARFESRLRADTTWLTNAFQAHVGGWGYDDRPKSGWYDNSLTQYGALGLWEAAKRGVPVDARVWQLLEQRFLDKQRQDGGWNYRGNNPVTGSMTAAGLTTLFITQDFLHLHDALDIGAADPGADRRAIARGLEWMDRNFTASENPGRNTNFFYYLYGVERVGLASGYKTFGGSDWFREGAAAILNRLGTLQQHHVRHLAFALMFLSRGRVPVAINKLDVPGLDWNNRPRDVANLTRWIGRETETALSWQIVPFDAEPETWLDAPMVYLSSTRALPEAALPRLKRYLDLGGLLLAVNENKSRDFGRSVLKAAQSMYPELRWRAPDKKHWAYTLLWPIKGRRPPLKTLSNGARDLIVLAPGGDLPATLQVRADDQPAFATAAHVYLYASEMNRPRPRLAATAAPGTAPPALRTATIVQARYKGNWNPEPLALETFAESLRQAGVADASIVEHPLAEIQRLDPPPALVVVTGVEPHEFTAPEREAIDAFVGAGGVILFETAGGRGDFARAARGVCPEAPRSLLNSRVITGRDLDGGTSLLRVSYRPYTRETIGGDTTPRLEGAIVNGQPRLLFSDFDLTFALLDQPRWQIAGYTPDSARTLMTNILLHALAVRAEEEEEN